MKKSLIALLLVALMLLSVMVGCKGKYATDSGKPAADTATSSGSSSGTSSGTATETKTERKTKDTLTVAIIEDMMSMDPQETNRASNWAIQRQVYNHLVKENPDGTVDPELATEWKWEDDTPCA